MRRPAAAALNSAGRRAIRAVSIRHRESSTCHRRVRLTVVSAKRSLLHRWDAPPATERSGEIDSGNIDLFAPVDWDREVAWEMRGDWGDLLTVEPTVEIAFE